MRLCEAITRFNSGCTFFTKRNQISANRSGFKKKVLAKDPLKGRTKLQ
jgi:hypothetical protein